MSAIDWAERKQRGMTMREACEYLLAKDNPPIHGWNMRIAREFARQYLWETING